MNDPSSNPIPTYTVPTYVISTEAENNGPGADGPGTEPETPTENNAPSLPGKPMWNGKEIQLGTVNTLSCPDGFTRLTKDQISAEQCNELANAIDGLAWASTSNPENL